LFKILKYCKVLTYIISMNNWKGSDLLCYKICVNMLLHQTCNRKMWAMSKLHATQRRCFHVICSFLYARKRDVLRKRRPAKKDCLRLRPIAFLSFDSPVVVSSWWTCLRRCQMKSICQVSSSVLPQKTVLRINSNLIFM